MEKQNSVSDWEKLTITLVRKVRFSKFNCLWVAESMLFHMVCLFQTLFSTPKIEKKSHWTMGYNSWFGHFGRSTELAQILYTHSTYSDILVNKILLPVNIPN